MSKLHRLAVLLAAAAALALVAGCGETVIDDVKTEEAIEHNLGAEIGMKVKSVDCPSDVEVVVKATFDCEVTLAGGGRQTAELRILNDDADVELVDLVDQPSGGDK